MWKKILGWFVAFIVVVVVLVMYATSGMSDVANEFFIYVKSKHYDDAYNMLSDDFKKSTSKEKFEEFLKRTALINYKEASWNERGFEGNTGTLKGDIITKNGQKIPITLTFTKNENDEWKIYSIYKPASGIVSQDEPKKAVSLVNNKQNNLPTKEEFKKIVKKDVLTFAKCINNKNMQQLYNKASSLWKSQITVEKLNNAYSSLFNKGIDFTVLDNMEPKMDTEPKVINGITKVRFHYNTSPNKVYFENGYVKENGEWLISGLYIKMK